VLRIFLVFLLVLVPGVAAAQTLDAVKTRGFVRCGATEPLAGFSQVTQNDIWTGFDVDMCRAVAAAVFGDPGRVEFISFGGRSRLAPLQNGDIDLMARNAAWAMRRDTSYGVQFIGVSYYDGQAFMMRNHGGVVSALELEDVSVCVIDNSDDLANLRKFFFEGQVTYTEVLYEDPLDLATAYQTGLCDVVTGPASWLFALRDQLGDPNGHRVLPERLSKEPTGPVVREGDDQWRNIVTWTLFAMINAEELGISSRNLEAMMETRTPAIRRLLGLEGDFGAPLGLEREWARQIIAGVGNYGEVFERNLGADTALDVPRGRNSLWTKGGLMFAPPIR